MDRNLPASPWPEWEIIAKIGEGSYGSVYKASRSEKGHAFFSAIKVISIPQSREELNVVMAETGDENTARLYFENIMEDCIREVGLMENFRGNSHIVSVEDYKVTEYLDEIGWDIFIRMEYLVSFPEYSAGKSFGKDEILTLGKDICRALQYLSQLEIVHRDIKPENIFVSRFGDYKLGDFGIARKLERSLSGLSRKGTWSYMAPEVYRGEACDARSDIYSLGIMLYRMMNYNRLPFVSTTKQLITYHDKEEALTRRMAGEPLPPPCEADGNTASIILKACAFRPSERYQKAEEMLKDLRLASEGLEAVRYSWETQEPVLPEAEETPEAYSVDMSVILEEADRPAGFPEEKAPENTPAKASEKEGQAELRAEAAKAGLYSDDFPEDERSADRQGGAFEDRQPEGRNSGEAGKKEKAGKKAAAANGKKGRKRSGAEDRKPKKSGRKENGTIDGFRRALPWIAAVLAIAVIVTILIGIYIRKMLVDTVREQTAQMVTSIQSRSTVPAEDEGQDFASSIELISERVTEIVNELPEDTQVGTEGEVLKYYSFDGELRKVLVYPDRSAEGMYEEYYYWNGDLFFAYIWDLQAAEMYYYRDGILIRWVDLDGKVHDNEQENEEYVTRGDKYWINSIIQKG